MGDFHPLQERCVDLLCTKTRRKERHYFRLLTVYYFSKMASMLRTNVYTKERGTICINTYILNLMPSGFGKGHSTNIFEENLICGFRKKFLNNIFPAKAELSLRKIALDRATRDNIAAEDSLEKVTNEFDMLGTLPFSFDSATGPALKQLRQKLLMASAGSLNIEIDEIAQNLLGNAEALNVLFELYDKGLVKQKLIKNTKENIRNEDIEGYTPTNLMMFGTPIRLLDGGRLEHELIEMLVSGYARRLLFGYSAVDGKRDNLSASEIYDSLTDNSVSIEETWLKNYFTNLATSRFNAQINMNKSVSIDLIQYQLDCEKKALSISKFNEMEKAEMIHRYFKVLKTSGAYAFVDKETSISQENLNHAIELVECSGTSFKRIQNREANYVRLARYLAEVGKDVTTVDLTENLQFYRGSKLDKEQLMSMAITWAYKNNVIIKRFMVDDIEFFSGESLVETSIDELILAHSANYTEGYINELAPFSKLKALCLLPNHQFTSHHLIDGYRDDAHVLQATGFNLAVIDVDGGTQVHEAQSLLEDYTYAIYTTKSSTDRKNRFRLILPMSHHVKLNPNDYRRFMQNIYDWLPFKCDTATSDRPRKWATNAGTYFSNQASLLDATQFIPRTEGEIKYRNKMSKYTDLNALQAWFVRNSENGNRNQMLLRYAFALLDKGMSEDSVIDSVLALNNKLEDPLSEEEIFKTIRITIAKRSARQ